MIMSEVLGFGGLLTRCPEHKWTIEINYTVSTSLRKKLKVKSD